MSTGHMYDASGTIATGGTAQELLPAKPGRRYLMVQNPIAAAETLRVNCDATATTTNSYELAPGGVLEFTENDFVPTSAVSILAATSAHAFIAKWG